MSRPAGHALDAIGRRSAGVGLVDADAAHGPGHALSGLRPASDRIGRQHLGEDRPVPRLDRGEEAVDRVAAVVAGSSAPDGWRSISFIGSLLRSFRQDDASRTAPLHEDAVPSGEGPRATEVIVEAAEAIPDGWHGGSLRLPWSRYGRTTSDARRRTRGSV